MPSSFPMTLMPGFMTRSRENRCSGCPARKKHSGCLKIRVAGPTWSLELPLQLWIRAPPYLLPRLLWCPRNWAKQPPILCDERIGGRHWCVGRNVGNWFRRYADIPGHAQVLLCNSAANLNGVPKALLKRVMDALGRTFKRGFPCSVLQRGAWG